MLKPRWAKFYIHGLKYLTLVSYRLHRKRRSIAGGRQERYQQETKEEENKNGLLSKSGLSTGVYFRHEEISLLVRTRRFGSATSPNRDTS